jgi:protein required for attachment to host cells
MDDFWIVVANRSIARIFARRRDRSIDELESLVCPEARNKDQSMISDAPGRSHDRKGPARHSMEPHTPVADQVAEGFAATVAEHLQSGLDSHSYRQLVLIADPDFLGHLRDALGHQCREQVAAEHPKNVAREGIDEIIEHLPEETQLLLRRPLLD